MSELDWMQRYAAEEVVEYARAGVITRRTMMRQLLVICGSASAAAALLAACGDDDSGTAGGTSSESANTTAPSSESSSSASTSASTGPRSSASPSSASTSASTTASTSSASSGSSARPSSSGSSSPGSSSSGPASGPSSSASTSASTVPTAGGPPLAVAANDPAIRGEDVVFPGAAGSVLGYLATPAAAGAPQSRAGVIVIHEIFGLTDHIRDVARRLAKAGYVALAVDLASRQGGTAKAGDNVTGAVTGGLPEERVADLDSGLAFLERQASFNGNLGVVGFCFGGGMTLSYAAAQAKVKAAVPYYGPTPQPASVMANTRAAILAQYGESDGRVNAGIADLEAAMKGKTFEKRIYAGAGHGFNNDTRASSYNERAAVDAWKATLDWFASHLA